MSLRSPILDLIVADEADLDGLVAYALYKRHKRQWCEDYENEHGKQPSAQQKMTFAKSCATADQIERYRTSAQDVLIAFAEAYLAEEKPEIARAAIKDRIELAAKNIESMSSCHIPEGSKAAS